MGTTAPRPLSERDSHMLIGFLAYLDGSLRVGELDHRLVHRLGTGFVNVGLLSRDAQGKLPSAGRVAIAMDNLIERLRYAVGEYGEEPAAVPEGTEHHLAFARRDAAQRCAADLDDDAVAVRVLHDIDGSWLVGAVFPDVAPDPGFHHREQALTSVATKFGGRYIGSSGAPGRKVP